MAKDPCNQTVINNAFYEDLKEGWYTADDHPIALLRAENALRAPWVGQLIQERFSKLNRAITILDVGCGAGFLSNYLAQEKHQVTGIDLSQSSLDVAKKFDSTSSVKYLHGNAYQLPCDDACFDVVCAMDILEHVEHPANLIQEASRVLKPGGMFFFHTFNRTWLSRMIVIKGVDWLVPNAPKDMHVYDLFITPEELKALCHKQHLQVELLRGFMPDICAKAFWSSLFMRKVSPDLRFKFVNSLFAGYCGFAIKDI
ncbi:MAG: 3-demethylubiquinone-9 3-O-methyltransferase [Parachlamydiaceae bacterium]|nr:3-demethylubiquinone-9 3-O-methyltransferase [Parachlamydiaceae bacterium]